MLTICSGPDLGLSDCPHMGFAIERLSNTVLKFVACHL